MAAFPESHEPVARGPRLLDVHCHDLDFSPLHEAIEGPKAFCAEARLDHDRSLDERGRRYPPRIGHLGRFVERTPLGLVLEDGEQRRGIDDHERGSPSSS